MCENDIKKGESGPDIGKQLSPKYEKGIGLHGPSNRVSKSPSTVKSFTDNMFLGDGFIKVQSGNSGMGRIIDIDRMNLYQPLNYNDIRKDFLRDNILV